MVYPTQRQENQGLHQLYQDGEQEKEIESAATLPIYTNLKSLCYYMV